MTDLPPDQTRMERIVQIKQNRQAARHHRQTFYLLAAMVGLCVASRNEVFRSAYPEVTDFIKKWIFP